jgi:hypothetical protein
LQSKPGLASLGTFVLRDLDAERSYIKAISNDFLLFDMNICLSDRKYLVVRSEIMTPLAYAMSFINNNSTKMTS